MSWWWKRSVAYKQDTENTASRENGEKTYKSVALIVGVTGIVGSSLAQVLTLPDTPNGPWKVYGVARRPPPPWINFSDHHHYIQLDVSDTKTTLSRLSPLSDITHIFYVSWVGSEDCSTNASMFRNILDAVVPNAVRLQHISLQTGTKHYFGVFEEGSKVKPHESPFVEDVPRLPVKNFYHDLEDILYEETRTRENLSWSVNRPALVFGFSPCGMMNIVRTLSVYAVIYKYENKALVYPGSKGSWSCYVDCVDADLIAEHCLGFGRSQCQKSGMI